MKQRFLGKIGLLIIVALFLCVACTPEKPCEGKYDTLQAYYDSAVDEIVVTIPSYYGLQTDQVSFLAVEGEDVSQNFSLLSDKTVSDSCRTQLHYRVETISPRFSVTIVLQESWGEYLLAYGKVTLNVGS